VEETTEFFFLYCYYMHGYCLIFLRHQYCKL